MVKLTISCLLAIIFSEAALAYEIDSHRQMAGQSYDLSELSASNGPLPLHGIHPDETFVGPGRVVGPVRILHAFTPKEWVQEGAELEDAFFDEFGLSFRFNNHFYNPVNGRGLSLSLPGFGERVIGLPSPTWGLADLVSPPNQLHSWQDALDYFIGALIDPDPVDRDENWAQTFRSLGHVVHLVEDGAQPQHTRNDAHGGILPDFFGDSSAYEGYAAEARRDDEFLGYPAVFESGDPGASTPFNSPRHFFETPDLLTSGRGITQFSNREFVSAGTNYRQVNGVVSSAPGFASPSASEVTIVPMSIQTLAVSQGVITNVIGTIGMVTTDVEDKLTGEVFPDRLTAAVSIFDDDLEQAGAERVFSLNSFNYKDASDLLMPRAVGYGAGILNFFFRVRISVIGHSFETIRTITNEGESGISGQFQVYYDLADGTRIPVGGPQAIALAPGASITLVPPNLGDGTGPHRMVFEGTTDEGVVPLAFVSSAVFVPRHFD